MKDALEYARDNNVSAVVFNGDTVEKGTAANYAILDGIFEEVFGDDPSAEGIPEFIFNMGNHEFYVAEGDMDYATQVGLYKTFAEKWSRNTISDNVYYRVIDGVYYIVAYPGNTGDANALNGYYSTADIAKIEDILEYVVGTGTDKPIILLTHWLLGKTYGGDYDALTGSYLTRFTTLLSDYPQVVHLTGHTHFSSLHQRALEQDDYTTINVGQFANGWFVSGLETDETSNTLTYSNVTGYRFNNDDPVSARLDANTYFGLLFGFTDSDLIVDRFNFAEERVSQRGWTIPYGITKANKSSKFYYEDSERSSETLHFATDTALTGIKNANGVLKAITFRDVLEYRDCEGYRIDIKNGSGSILKTVFWMSRFWADLGYRSDYYVPVSGLSHTGTYTIAIYAIDHYGNYSTQYSSATFVTDEEYADKSMFAAGADFEYTTTLSSYSTLTFDYKITTGSTFVLAVTGDSMSNYYGYFTFGSEGEDTDYAGVTCVDNGDGWMSVTITFANVTKIKGVAPETLKRFFIRGTYTDADGYVANITFS